ncbi:enoyl-CoA hydratase/isomerase family protein [Oceanicella actignis]|uniref:3-hydroxyisobutyryl-CoA hydrolase n=1 Tax=Oceanicella actignis TaxID=1189325 RepID=A0A1M7T6K8_9RHOB|nr:enoyl-CoA hydratase/isomerase family protein [Oceanicella actignis]TYO84821.1 enoyl-CoA hydratase [Oceanicella actignis]SET44654.1 enoyl-CoA hydratase [Oceanicella actignis]SHN66282.1 enoyl-CoA hydratase [Oceanicella actignis]
MAEVEIRVSGRAGRITLNRPKALNALTHEMALEIERALRAWREDPRVQLVVIDGAGDRAFCAGGDIQLLYDRGRAGDFAYGRRFWADEYRLNALIGAYPKPYVALMDGIVMGGGVGVSAHGSHRVVTERTLLAMPECGIGLVPDVGGTFILSRAPGRLGEHLGLTGARVGAGDAILTGFADVYMRAERLPALIAELEASGDPAAIAAMAEPAPEATLAPLRPAIDRAYDAPDALGVVRALEASDEAWAQDAARAIRRNCPLSVACALRLIREARALPDLKAALAREYRFSWRCTEEGEFLEGIRAAVIDKDRSPRWQVARLEDLPPEKVDAMLAPLGENELTL